MKRGVVLILSAFVFISCKSQKNILSAKKSEEAKPKAVTDNQVLKKYPAAVDYIERFKEVAVQEMNKYGIPASITLAQGLLESGNGNSSLARESNNHFGIKCADWKGKKTYKDDDAENELIALLEKHCGEEIAGYAANYWSIPKKAADRYEAGTWLNKLLATARLNC